MAKAAQVVSMIGLFCATPALDSTGASSSQQLSCPRQSLCISCSRYSSRQAYLRRSRRFLCANRIPLKRSTQRLGSRRGSRQQQLASAWGLARSRVMSAEAQNDVASRTKGKCSQRSTQLFATSQQLGQVQSSLYVCHTEICSGSLLDQA